MAFIVILTTMAATITTFGYNLPYDEQERQKMRLYFDEIQPAANCSSFGARKYTARLRNLARSYDGVAVCMHTPLAVHGVDVGTPDFCDGHVGRPMCFLLIHSDISSGSWSGLWSLAGEGESANLHNVLELGQRQGTPPPTSPMLDQPDSHRLGMYHWRFWLARKNIWFHPLRVTSLECEQRYEARLENLRHVDDWEEMCSTTPAAFAFHRFAHPDSCTNRVSAFSEAHSTSSI
jgi:hypothetical protein